MTVLPLAPPGRKPPPRDPSPLAVVPDVAPTPCTDHPTVEIPLRLCRASSTQPRRGKLDVVTLQEDIRRHGLLQSIWVRTKRYTTADPVTGETTYYEIAFGHRREFACRGLGWETIRAEVHDELTDRQVFEMQLSENREHAPLTDLEEADAIALYMRPEAEGGFGVTEVAEVAARLSISVATVYRRMGLARLTQLGRASLDEGKLYLASAYAIASILDPDAQNECLKEALDGETAVLGTFRLAGQILGFGGGATPQFEGEFIADSSFPGDPGQDFRCFHAVTPFTWWRWPLAVSTALWARSFVHCNIFLVSILLGIPD